MPVGSLRRAGGSDNALENERNKLDNQLGDVISAIGNVAAHDSEAAKVLPELSNAVEPAAEQSRRRHVRPTGRRHLTLGATRTVVM